jgi:hypothetical protein
MAFSHQSNIYLNYSDLITPAITKLINREDKAYPYYSSSTSKNHVRTNLLNIIVACVVTPFTVVNIEKGII